MDQKQRLLIISVLMVSVLIGSASLVYLLAPNESASPILPGAFAPAPSGPSVKLFKRGGNLILAWNNLPEGTTHINIYRAKRGEEQWEKWKTIAVDAAGTAGGSAEIKAEGDAHEYVYYTEAVGSSGGGNGTQAGSGGNGAAAGDGKVVLWISSTTITIIETTESPETPPAAPASPSPSATQPQQQGAPASSATSSSATATSSSFATPPAGGSSGTSGPAYYTPSGEISGQASFQTETFWVQHVNRNIEIGWQNIPAATDAVIVYRSTSESGGWKELLRQNNPPLSYSIRLVDNTITTGHYYRMEAKDGSTILGAYGPVFLPALE